MYLFTKKRKEWDFRMIDFHSHILPNIDDGSQSIDETFNLLKEAESVGFDKIISTSHYMENYYETENKEREFWVKSLSQRFSTQNIDVKLFLGNEIYITESLIDLLKSGKAATINNTCYVLFEMPFNIEPLNMYDIIYEMTKNKLVPILAHPERYKYIQKKPEIVSDLIEAGVLMQSNYGSVIGLYGKKEKLLVTKLLENNMVHFLGSDVHRQNTIYPKIPKILKELKEFLDEQYIDELTTKNAELVLGNKKIDIKEFGEIQFSFKEKLIMNWR